MRIITFFAFLIFLLLGSKGYSYTPINQGKSSYTSVQNFTQKGQIKVVIEEHGITLIEDTDVDLEEECQSSNDVKEQSGNHFFLGKYSLINTLYCSTSKKFTLNYREKHIKFLPYLSGNNNPIYITQRVLRI
jgi:hypothetical protein